MKSCLWHGEIKTSGFDEIRLWRMKYLPSANVVESYIFEIEDFKNGRSPADCYLRWIDLKFRLRRGVEDMP